MLHKSINVNLVKLLNELCNVYTLKIHGKLSTTHMFFRALTKLTPSELKKAKCIFRTANICVLVLRVSTSTVLGKPTSLHTVFCYVYWVNISNNCWKLILYTSIYWVKNEHIILLCGLNCFVHSVLKKYYFQFIGNESDISRYWKKI